MSFARRHNSRTYFASTLRSVPSLGFPALIYRHHSESTTGVFHVVGQSGERVATSDLAEWCNGEKRWRLVTCTTTRRHARGAGSIYSKRRRSEGAEGRDHCHMFACQLRSDLEQAVSHRVSSRPPLDPPDDSQPIERDSPCVGVTVPSSS